MKLALIGKNISHSRSPAIYKKLISDSIHYDLLDIAEPHLLPDLKDLAAKYQGISITSPYKTNYVSQVQIPDAEVRELGSINCISFTPHGPMGTNTDLIAVRKLLTQYKAEYPGLHLIILGRGVMGRLTEIVARGLKLSFITKDRKAGLTSLTDLSPLYQNQVQNLIINATSRDFVFTGTLKKDSLFWDFNYNFLPHQNTLPFKIKMYFDGQEMLWIQAEEAIKFWDTTNAKLKC